MVDTVGATSMPTFTHMHASIAPIALTAGTYYFGLHEIDSPPSTLVVSTIDLPGTEMFLGTDPIPDFLAGADARFMLDGNAVPEPTSMALVGIGAAGLGYFHRLDSLYPRNT